MASQTKTSLDKQTIATLQDLIQINVDARAGLAEAAEKVSDVTLSATFEQIALERQDHIAELRTLVTANAEKPDSSGSVAAAAHRAWMDLRAALGGGPQAILSEAERGEDHIVAKYESALDAAGAGPVADVLRRQFVSVKKAHDRIRDLRDQYQGK